MQTHTANYQWSHLDIVADVLLNGQLGLIIWPNPIKSSPVLFQNSQVFHIEATERGSEGTLEQLLTHEYTSHSPGVPQNIS